MTDDLNLTPPENLRSRMLSGGAWVLFGKTITVLCTLFAAGRKQIVSQVSLCTFYRMVGQVGMFVKGVNSIQPKPIHPQV